MEPEPGNSNEVIGVLNPAAVRDPDGKLSLFPRLVAKGNYSRIGVACLDLPEHLSPGAPADGSRTTWKLESCGRCLPPMPSLINNPVIKAAA